ncbi:MAG: hypothetical protein J6X18_03215, partial [Bacteroidales bacterium]|nr:hypothetical protein [Bacteroidales bacterium]
RIDGSYTVPKGEMVATNRNIWQNNYAQTLSGNSYQDITGSSLNSKIDNIPTQLASDKTNLYSFGEVAYAIAAKNNYNIANYLSPLLTSTDDDRMQHLTALLNNKVESITVEGYANSQGYVEANKILANSRENLLADWLRKMLKRNVTLQAPTVKEINTKDENTLDAKMYRFAKCTIRFKNDETKVSNEENGENYEMVGNTEATEISQAENTSYNEAANMAIEKGVANEELASNINNLQPKQQPESDTKKVTKGKTTGTNKIRYDNEMFFYKKFKAENPFKFKALSDKLQYFDPAFHSMTPEGFNMRLTFLQQCTRQGDTISASEKNAKTASNMAFGRPPFCVLRLGDFYNQMIVIKSLNIVYDDDGALTWDLNDEGIGAQPMIAKVTIGFDFIGGGDLAGPVRRLQNAMSFNYYANASLYDNRADRMYYEAEENLSTAMGGNSANSKPSMPVYDEKGNIISKKGTYTVFNSISKDDTDETAQKRVEEMKKKQNK